MKFKSPLLLAFCAIALCACAGMGPKEQVGGEPTARPLTCVEQQQYECRTRLNGVEGASIEPRDDCVAVTFGCDAVFDRDTAGISPSVCGLDNLAEVLKVFPNCPVRVDAHTDCMRSEEENLELSEMRACALKEALVAKGVDSLRITARGWGESKPVASNATEEGRRSNRRITVTLLPDQSS